MTFKSTKERKRFFRFAVVGISGTIVDFSVYNLLIIHLLFNPTLASVLSFSLAVFNNFIWNRLWTYPESKESSFLKQIIQFSLVSLIGLSIRILLFFLIEKPFTSLARLLIPDKFILHPEIIGYNLTLASAIIVVLFWNFFANRFWTYNEVH
ncbi:MAG TPA: GtrA family protein [Anaerolineae bacterium]|nr:GtrA family protein [Anaerolineae bacterium]